MALCRVLKDKRLFTTSVHVLLKTQNCRPLRSVLLAAPAFHSVFIHALERLRSRTERFADQGSV